MLSKLLFTVFLYFCTAPAIANEHSAEQIRAVIESFVHQETRHLPGNVILRSIGSESSYAQRTCQQPEAFLPPGGRLWGKFSVGVRCQDEATWTIYVPVEIAIMADVVYAARPINAKEVVSTADIVVKEANLVRLPRGVVTDSAQAVGNVAVTFLTSGQPIRANQLRAPYIIQRGQKVRLIATGAGFSVSSEGEALANAAEGEVIQVRNHTKRVISGVARPGGIVEIRQ